MATINDYMDILPNSEYSNSYNINGSDYMFRKPVEKTYMPNLAYMPDNVRQAMRPWAMRTYPSPDPSKYNDGRFERWGAMPYKDGLVRKLKPLYPEEEYGGDGWWAAVNPESRYYNYPYHKGLDEFYNTTYYAPVERNGEKIGYTRVPTRERGKFPKIYFNDAKIVDNSEALQDGRNHQKALTEYLLSNEDELMAESELKKSADSYDNYQRAKARFLTGNEGLKNTLKARRNATKARNVRGGIVPMLATMAGSALASTAEAAGRDTQPLEYDPRVAEYIRSLIDPETGEYTLAD